MAADTRRDIKLSAAGDWDVTTGDLEVLAGADAIIQSALIHCEFFKGEWFLDLGAGIPYWQQVLTKLRDPNVLQPIFRKALLEILGVTGIASLRLRSNRAARTLDVTFELIADVGLLGPVSRTVG